MFSISHESTHAPCCNMKVAATKMVKLKVQVSLCFLCTYTCIPHALQGATSITQVIVLGDSLSDDGMLYHLTNGTLPPTSLYMSPTHGFTDGQIWHHTVAARGLKVVSLAVAGSTGGCRAIVSSLLLEPMHGLPGVVGWHCNRLSLDLNGTLSGHLKFATWYPSRRISNSSAYDFPVAN